MLVTVNSNFSNSAQERPNLQQSVLVETSFNYDTFISVLGTFISVSYISISLRHIFIIFMEYFTSSVSFYSLHFSFHGFLGNFWRRERQRVKRKGTHVGEESQREFIAQKRSVASNVKLPIMESVASKKKRRKYLLVYENSSYFIFSLDLKYFQFFIFLNLPLLPFSPNFPPSSSFLILDLLVSSSQVINQNFMAGSSPHQFSSIDDDDNMHFPY